MISTTFIFPVLVTLFFSAFFSGLEMAFISANKLQIEVENKQGALTGKILSSFLQQPGQFLGTTLIGNTIALVLYGIFMANLLEPLFLDLLPNSMENQATLLVTQTVVATIVVLITAEFIPKSIFMLNPNGLLNALVIPFLFVFYLMYPVVWVVVGLSRFFITQILRLPYSEDKPVFKVTDLNAFIQDKLNLSKGELTERGMEVDAKILDKAVEFKTIRIRECMVPRTDIVAVEVGDSIRELQEAFETSGHSKIIVYKESIDDVIGYCHQLELFKHPKTIQEILTPIIIVPESALANELLIQFIRERKSMALVVDEFGGTSGIVSMEDIIEEIFGEIQDEYDIEELTEQKVSDTEYLLSARHEVDYLNEKYNWQLPYGEFETLSGFILSLTENIPQKGESVTFGPFTFTVVAKQDHRIETIRVKIHEPLNS
ncbi:MAG: hemolysin family protein [Nitritalea sp.]